MRARPAVLLLAAIFLAGCDRLTGAADQKIADAEAIGYACRVSQKKPEDCMKENEAQSPSSVLDGWKNADKDIKEKKINPDMIVRPPAVVIPAATSAPAETDNAAKTNGDKPAEKPTAAHGAETPKPAAH